MHRDDGASRAGARPISWRSRRNSVTIAKAGGEDRIKSCGHVFSGPFQVPSVAWRLHMHINEVGIFPFGPGTSLAMGSTPLSVASSR